MAENKRIYIDEDTRLMIKASNGDKKAYGTLYRKYFFILADYAKSLNGTQVPPEDIAQEIFVRVWKNREKYTPNSTIKTYLFGYAKNILWEEKSRSTQISSYNIYLRENNLLPSKISPDPESDSDPAESQDMLKYAMSRLPPKQKVAIELFYIKKMSLLNAARYCNCHIKAFESRLIRARNKLRQLLRTSKVHGYKDKNLTKFSASTSFKPHDL